MARHLRMMSRIMARHLRIMSRVRHGKASPHHVKGLKVPTQKHKQLTEVITLAVTKIYDLSSFDK